MKKTALSAYSNVRSGGIIAINIEEDDELLSVRITDGENQIFLGTRQGMGIRFPENDVRAMGRDTTGVNGIEPQKKDDVVVEMDIVDESGQLLSVTENGYGKRLGSHRVPAPEPRRLGGDQRQGDREERPRRRDQVGHRRRSAAPDQRDGAS